MGFSTCDRSVRTFGVFYSLPFCLSSHNACDGWFPTCLNSKRISDLLVGVQHDSDTLAHGSRGQVSDELGADDTSLSVGGGDLSPDCLVLKTSLLVLGFEDVGDTLAVVEGACLAVSAALNVDESSVLFLSSLASLESHEDCFGVESTNEWSATFKRTYLTGCLVVLVFDFVSMSTFNLILMY